MGVISEVRNKDAALTAALSEQWIISVLILFGSIEWAASISELSSQLLLASASFEMDAGIRMHSPID